MKKQVSFDDSITDTVDAKYAQHNFNECKMYHSMVPLVSIAYRNENQL
jgi:hypothetical protein